MTTQIQLTKDQEERFEEHGKKFNRLQETLNACREFVNNHRDELAQVPNWSCWGWDMSLDISPWGEHDPKSIAKVFGVDGWVRKHNSSACGQIDWQKTIDGITVSIINAENIKPKMIETVKL